MRDFWATLEQHNLSREDFLDELTPGQRLPWHIVESGVREKFYQFEWRLAHQARTGLHCPPGSVNCQTCGVCDDAWAHRFEMKNAEKTEKADVRRSKR